MIGISYQSLSMSVDHHHQWWQMIMIDDNWWWLIAINDNWCWLMMIDDDNWVLKTDVHMHGQTMLVVKSLSRLLGGCCCAVPTFCTLYFTVPHCAVQYTCKICSEMPTNISKLLFLKGFPSFKTSSKVNVDLVVYNLEVFTNYSVKWRFNFSDCSKP